MLLDDLERDRHAPIAHAVDRPHRPASIGQLDDTLLTGLDHMDVGGLVIVRMNHDAVAIQLEDRRHAFEY